MYKIIIILVLLQSCLTIGKLPRDLPQSLLIVELLPTNYEEYYDSKTTNKEIKWYSEKASKNKLINEKTINIFSKYPYFVKFVQHDEISKNYDSTKTNYLLGYGNLDFTTSTVTLEINNIVLQNLLTGSIVKKFRVTTNINSIAPKFIDKATKLTP